jgi:hypothetical protein
MRFLLVQGVVAALALGFSTAVASADASGGSVTGRITCGDDESTPAAHIVVAAEGLHLQTLTDATGHFTLSGVPTSGPITIEAIADPEASFIVERRDVSLAAGETLDIGSMDLAVCGQPQGVPQSDQDVLATEH